MTWYAAIDLHSNTNVMVVIDAHDHVVYQQRLANERAVILPGLAVYQADQHGIAVESTSNWYGLVDGLREHGSRVHRVNTAAIHQYADSRRPTITAMRAGSLPCCGWTPRRLS